jgi:hypothetical protein
MTAGTKHSEGKVEPMADTDHEPVASAQRDMARVQAAQQRAVRAGQESLRRHFLAMGLAMTTAILASAVVLGQLGLSASWARAVAVGACWAAAIAAGEALGAVDGVRQRPVRRRATLAAVGTGVATGVALGLGPAFPAAFLVGAVAAGAVWVATAPPVSAPVTPPVTAPGTPSVTQ